MKDFQNKIDEFFRGKLEKKTHQATESDWQAMEQLLDSQSGDAGAWFGRNKYLFGILILALIGIGGWFYWQSDEGNTKSIAIEQIQIEQKNDHIIKTAKGTENSKAALYSDETFQELNDGELQISNDVVHKKQEVLIEDEKDIEIVTSNNDITVIESEDDQYFISASDNISSISSDAAIVNSDLSANEPMGATKEQSEIMNISNKNTSNSDHMDLIDNSGSEEEITNVKAVNESQGEVIQKQVDGNVGTDSQRLSDVTSESQSASAKNEVSKISNIETEPIVNSNTVLKEEPEVEKQEIEKTQVLVVGDSSNSVSIVKALNTSRSNRKFVVTMFGGPAFISKSLNADNDRGSDYMDRRKNEEDNVVDLHFGIEGAYQFNNFSISTGLEFASYGEKVNYEPHSFYDFVSIDTTIEKVDSVWVQNTPGGVFGYWEYDYDTSVVQNINTIDTANVSIAAKNGRTTWKYIEIPVLIRYGFDAGKFYVNAGVGGSIGLLQSVNSFYLNPNLTSLEEFNSSGNYRSTVFNFIGAAGINYKFNANWMVGMDLRFKQNISSVFKEDYPVKQKYRSILTGLSLKFNITK